MVRGGFKQVVVDGWRAVRREERRERREEVRVGERKCVSKKPYVCVLE